MRSCMTSRCHAHDGTRGRQCESAFSSSALLIAERPLMLRFLASLYSCSLVRPCAPVCDRLPPRCPEDTSFTEERRAVLDSPWRARSLLTVRAAISSARSVDSPRFLALALMCLYCRFRFGEDPAGIACSFPDMGSGQRMGLPPV